MQTCIYTLPELTFVGGKTQELNFRLKEMDGSLYNAKYCTANFSICNYSNKVGTPLISITPTFIANPGESGSNIIYILHVVLPAEKTVDLCGKYIYQIVIMDDTHRVEIPNQGIMNITRNINIDGTEKAIQNNGFIML